MLNGILQIPKIPMGNPKIPILLHNGHTNSSSWSKDPNWNYEISAYIRIPGISAPNIFFACKMLTTSGMTYPSHCFLWFQNIFFIFAVNKPRTLGLNYHYGTVQGIRLRYLGWSGLHPRMGDRNKG